MPVICRLIFCLVLCMSCGFRICYAVVGQAEKHDEFKQEELQTFHQNLIDEERDRQAMLENLAEVLQTKRDEIQQSDQASQEILRREIGMMKEKLLSLPKRDRFQFEMVGDYKFDSNVIRAVPRKEKNDSIFDTRGTVITDLSGKKTDLKFEVNGSRQWNYEFSEKDLWEAGSRLRYRRKYFKKIQHSASSNVNRNNSKTIEIDNNKIRWDFNNVSAVNYAFSRKMALNFDVSQTKRLFAQEAFDQDSNWQSSFTPSGFWNLTPKSRMSFGYGFGVSRARLKTGDSNSHDFKVGYFGKVSRKSSASIDLAFTHQTPKSRDTAIGNTITTGMGYVYQVTPKTQMTFQYTRSMQNTTSNLASGEVDGENTTVKTDTHFVSDNMSLSFNARLVDKLTTVLTTSVSHTQNKAYKDGSKDSESRQFEFPLSLSLTYLLKRWMTLNVTYSFSFRTGDEKADTYRDHIIGANLRIVF